MFKSLYAILLLLANSTTNATNATDQLALLDFKNSIETPNNILAHNWTTDVSFCHWFGVICSLRRQRISSLNLAGLNLQGTISPSIGNLSFLVELNLGDNNFHGSIPNGIGLLPRLQSIELQNNQLEGSIPSTLFRNQKIKTINLAYNKFSGELWKEWWNLPSLRVLNLTSNNLTGTIMHPSIGNISNIQILVMNSNSLTGTIPREIGNLSRLARLDLSLNQLMGSVPDSIFGISSLQLLYISNNHLSGSFGIDTMNSMPNLQALDFSRNFLTGEIPPSLCRFSGLLDLFLDNNNLTGQIPKNIDCLTRLERFYMGVNQIGGTIPPSLANISTLQFLGCRDNNIEGSIPEELVKLSNAKMIDFDFDHLTGEIPQGIFNISSLKLIAFTSNRLTGQIPAFTGLNLQNLEGIFLAENQLDGLFPAAISNASKLTELEISYNLFTGLVPTNFGNLRELEFLNIAGNQLTKEPGNPELGFLNSLVHCRKLQYVVAGSNPLDGTLPHSIGNLSSTIEMFNIEFAQLQGQIPRGIGNLSGVLSLALTSNNLIGRIPSEIGSLKKLQRLYLAGNKLEGTIPEEICGLIYLGNILLSENEISGSIQDCIGNLVRLQILGLSSNKLRSSIPSTLWGLEGLIFLNISDNHLEGELSSEIRRITDVNGIDLSRNQLSGSIPSSIADLKSLSYLSLAHNSFQGQIPESLGNLISLELLDLSSNTLTGFIPTSLENLTSLKQINLSFNHLQGEIPDGGVFANSSTESFMGNGQLCGLPRLQFPPCSNIRSRRTGIKRRNLKIIILVIASVTLLTISVCIWFIRRFYLNKRMPNTVDLPALDTMNHQMVSYHELQKATDNFSSSNLLGQGSSGSVYKGKLDFGTLAAIKVLNLQSREAIHTFDKECDVLKKVRHRNICKVITTCSNLDVRILVLQYMPNGSLESWLYSENKDLDLVERINIMLDVAMAMDYLHHNLDDPIVHCDLKPSNILLDQDMVAHVCDFGISKILAQNNEFAQTKTLGTIGYIAPEYGLNGIVTTSGDIYSYGIMMMETFTKRKPTDDMFADNWSLREWIRTSFPRTVMKIMDQSINLDGDEKTCDKIEACCLSLMELALDCSTEAAGDRIRAKDVVVRIKKIKESLLEGMK